MTVSGRDGESGMHILMVPAYYPRSYNPLPGNFYRDQAIALRNYGATVGVIDPAPRSIKTLGLGRVFSHHFQITTENEAGIPVVRGHDWCIPYARKTYARQFMSRAVSLFKTYIGQFGRPDVIHGQSILWGGVAARAIAIGFGIPYLVTEHSGEYAMSPVIEWTVPFIEATIRDAAGVLAVSASLGRHLTPFAGGATIQVVSNVVDTGFFDARSKRDSTRFTFAAIASEFVMNKGIDILLRGFATAFAENHSVALEIGGDGADREELQALSVDLGIADRVKWLGQLTREEVRDCLGRADALVLASHYETFGVVLIEAMAMGLPVIATKCGGPDDFVDTNTGYLVAVGQADQISAAMSSLYRDRDEWRQKAPLIRQSAVDRFGQRAIADQLVHLYQDAITRRPSAAAGDMLETPA